MPLADLATTISKPASESGGTDLRRPRISIVTPSFNQARYLDETIRSVLSQAYPNLDYSIIDGGSTDGSAEIVRSYQSHLSRWVSEPDRGQYHAINKGLSKSTGEIMAWINSDDKYCPWALQTVADIFSDCPEISWLTSSSPLFWNAAGHATSVVPVEAYSAKWFYQGRHLGEKQPDRGWIQQESTFWRRSLWEAAGGRVDDTLRYAGDFELWARFWQHAPLATVSAPLGGFRYQPLQKTKHYMADYYEEAHQILAGYADQARPPSALGQFIRSVLRATRRGRRVFGERVRYVYYEHDEKKWHADWTHVL